jgi:hypothetical protein
MLHILHARHQLAYNQIKQRSLLLVFYVGYILDDKNTLYNGCKLTGWSVFNLESSCIQTMFKSKKVTDHKLLEDVHEESLQNPRQNSRSGRQKHFM